MEKFIYAALGWIFGFISKIAWDWMLKRHDDTRDRCKAVEELLMKFERRGTLYWSHAGNDETAVRAAREMKIYAKRLSSELNMLGKRGFSVRNCQVSFIHLRKAAMGGNFEVLTREPDSSRIEQIQDASVELIEELRNSLKVI